jgi:hypothetical protein
MEEDRPEAIGKGGCLVGSKRSNQMRSCQTKEYSKPERVCSRAGSTGTNYFSRAVSSHNLEAKLLKNPTSTH